MTKLTIVLAIAAVVILSVAFVGTRHSSQDAYGQVQYYHTEQNTTSVTGSATASVVPDLVVIQLGVDTQAKVAEDAMAENAKAMNSTASALEKLGINSTEISTTNFTIEPVYNNTGPFPPYDQYRSVLVGYKVSNTLEIKTTKLGLAGNILDTAVETGANRVDNVAFTLSPRERQSIENSLIDQAVLDAKSKAEKALSPLGEKIVGVKSVNLSGIQFPRPIEAYGKVAMSGVAAPAVATPIFTSNQDITTSVDVIFFIGEQ